MRVAYFLTHPIQYQSPLIRALAGSGMDLRVFYATDSTSRAYFDPGYGREVAWDIPLLDGYPHTILNTSDPPGGRRQKLAHYLAQARAALDEGGFGAVWIHGWRHPFAVAAWKAAKSRDLPIMVRGDTFLGSINASSLKRVLHRAYYTWRFRQPSVFLAIGTLNRDLYRHYGVPDERIVLMPHAVDNTFFQQKAREARARRDDLRAELGIEPGRPIILFCGRLSLQKDPATLIRATGALAAGLKEKPVLLLAGDGPIRAEMESLAGECAPGCARFLGFRNQTELPALYDLCDVFVLPSEFEPWGLVVNEVMNAAKPVIVSDLVGAAPDLVKPGCNGEVFRTGDVRDLQQKLRTWLTDATLRERGGAASLDLINHWSFQECITAMREALGRLEARPTTRLAARKAA